MDFMDFWGPFWASKSQKLGIYSRMFVLEVSNGEETISEVQKPPKTSFYTKILRFVEKISEIYQN